MSHGGATQMIAPIGWVFLDRHREDGFTIRWRRGEPVANVRDGKRVGDHAMTGVLGKLPVAPTSWTDLAEVGPRTTVATSAVSRGS